MDVKTTACSRVNSDEEQAASFSKKLGRKSTGFALSCFVCFLIFVKQNKSPASLGWRAQQYGRVQ
jgi:hypothetical protein